MNIAIVNAFIALKQLAMNYKDLAEQINEIRQTVTNHNDQLNQIYDAIENLLDDKAEQKSWKERERIGFKKCLTAFVPKECLWRSEGVPSEQKLVLSHNLSRHRRETSG